jgi:hypothetical protein
MQLEEDRVAGRHLHAIREALSMQLEEDRVAGRHLHAIREALSMQLGRWHRDGMLRVAEERAAPFEVGHVVQGDDV